MRSIQYFRASIGVLVLSSVLTSALAVQTLARDCNAAATNYEEQCAFEFIEPDLDFSVPNPTPTAQPFAAIFAAPLGPAAPESAMPIPFELKPTDTGVSAKTSIGTLRDYNSRLTTRQYDSVKGLSSATLTTPKTVLQKPAIDIWTNIDAQGYSDPSSAPDGNDLTTLTSPSASKMTRTSAGADYALGSSALLGIAAERSQTVEETAAPRDDEKLAAFAAFKATPGLSIQAKTQWERGIADFGAGMVANEKSSISVSPRLSHPFALDGGQSLEPYVTIKQEFAVDAASSEQTGSAGAGLTLTQPNTYSLSVSTDVDGLGRDEPATVKGQLQLKLPLP